MKSHLKELRNTLGLFRGLAWREGDGIGALRWLLSTTLGRRAIVPVQIQGERLLIRTGTHDLQVALSCLRGEFDDVIKALPNLKHGLIIDAGGYIGTAAIAFARAYPDAKIVTVEPSRENFALVAWNTRNYPNITLVQGAVASTHEQAQLCDRGTGEWGFTLVNDPADRAASPIGIVDCVTVDEIIAQLGRTGVDIFKIDIEGGEMALLTGNTDWVNRTTAICIELHDRIIPGCSTTFERVTAGRSNRQLAGEKVLSLAA